MKLTRVRSANLVSPVPAPTSASASATADPPRPAGTGAGPATLSGLGLFTVLLGAALPLIDFFIVNVALPAMDHDLHAGPAVLELVVAGYAVAYAVLPGARRAARRHVRPPQALRRGHGGLRHHLAGLRGLAPNAWSLVAARVAQGAAAAFMLPQVLATTHATTAGGRRARAIGLYGATAGFSMVAGQILGGVLVAADLWGTGWRMVFLVNVPAALIGLALAVRTVPETRSDRPTTVDVPGTLLLALSLITLLLPLTEGRAAGWPLWTWLLLGSFPVVAAVFYLVERRADRAGRVPLVPPSLFALPGLSRGLVLVVPFSIGFGGFMFVIAVALQQGMDYGPVAARLALVPMAVAFFVVSLTGPRLVGRYGSRVITVGALFQGLGIGVFLLTVARGWPDTGIPALAPGLVLAGVGQALQLPVLFRIVLADVPSDRAGVGSGVMVTTQQSALALGVATLGTLSLSRTASVGMRDALITTLLVQLAKIAVTAVLSLRLPRVVR